MKKPTITTIASGYYSRQALNTNFENLRDSFDNTLSLDGSTPNAMGADLDMNGNDILNAGTLAVADLTVAGLDVNTALNSAVSASAASAVASNVSAVASAASASSAALYDGPWINDVATLLADTTLTLTPGQPNTVVIGDYVRTRKEGFSYEVVASGGDVTTAGSIQLDVVAGQSGFDVRAFGADPTGVVDSASAINAAFAACEAAGAGTILFHSGTYLSTVVVGSSGSTNLTDIKIVGYGATLNSNPTVASNYAMFLYWPNLNSIVVSGLHIDGNLKTASGIMVNNQSATTACVSAIVEDCHVENINAVDDASITVNPTGIYVNSTFEGDNVIVRNCVVKGVTRAKAGLSCGGVVVTGFRLTTIEGNFIDNVRHSGLGGDLADADGIKVFSKFSTVGANNIYYDVNALIQNNVVYDCEGRFVKTQANGQVKIDSNSFRIDGAIELIENFSGVDCQTGEGLVTNNDFFFGGAFTGGGSACVYKASCPTESTNTFRSFTQTFSGNKVDIVKKINYVVLPTTPAASTTNSFKLYLNVLNNTVNVANATNTATTATQTGERPSAFIYVNNTGWPTAANLNGELHWKINDNMVDTYDFLVVTTGSVDYTGKWFLHIHNNVKYPTGFNRSLLAPSTSYTSNLSISGNNMGASSDAVHWPFDFTKLVSPCDFYNASGTRTNGPAAYSYRNVQLGGAIWKVVDATGIYLTANCTTWTRI
jgi:hypothetical protein